jgi:hypothetical protein
LWCVSLLVLLPGLAGSCAAHHLQEKSSTQVDAVIFSYNRPMQLYALLESVEKHLRGIYITHVIYRASDENYSLGYRKVIHRFPHVLFHKQSSQAPALDFKPLVVASVFSTDTPYVMFAVDDDIVTDDVDLTQCTAALRKYNVWGFYLRFGKNITHSFARNLIISPCPLGRNTSDSFFIWRFSDGRGDWYWANSVDMTIYRKSDVRAFLMNDIYDSPNKLEVNWQRRWFNPYRYGICFQTSKIINLPLNMVGSKATRCENGYSPQFLLGKFFQGYKIDISKFNKIRNRSAHVDYPPTFIRRDN